MIEYTISSDYSEWCYDVAYNEERSDVKRLQQIVIIQGDDKWCYYFSRWIPSAGVDSLRNRLRR